MIKPPAGVPDVKTVSSQPTVISQLTASVETSVMTTHTSSTPLVYSSSGPTLEECLHNIKVHTENKTENPATLVLRVLSDGHRSSSSVSSPHSRGAVEVLETTSDGFDSHSSNISSQSSSSAAPLDLTTPHAQPTTPPPPPTQEEVGTCDPATASETHSLQVNVSSDGGVLEAPSPVEAADSPASSSSRSLTDISTCSSRNDSSPVVRAETSDLQCNAAEDAVETTTVTHTSRQTFAAEGARESEDKIGGSCERVEEGTDDKCASSSEHVLTPTQPHTIQELHTGRADGKAVTTAVDQKLISSDPASYPTGAVQPAGSQPTAGGATGQQLLAHSSR